MTRPRDPWIQPHRERQGFSASGPGFYVWQEEAPTTRDWFAVLAANSNARPPHCRVGARAPRERTRTPS